MKTLQMIGTFATAAVCLAAATIGVGTAKDAPSAAQKAAHNDGRLAEFTQSGGLTVHGPAHCEFLVFDNGKFDLTTESLPLTHGAIEPADLAKLRGEIKKTDFSKWIMTPAAYPPSAADGGDTTLGFWFKGQKQSYKLWEMKNPQEYPLINTMLSLQTKYRQKAESHQ